jgi:hypothetical protein
MAVDQERLAYYEAWALLRRLCRYGRCLCAGPEATGAKPSFTKHLRPDHVETLCSQFESLTGIRVGL